MSKSRKIGLGALILFLLIALFGPDSEEEGKNAESFFKFNTLNPPKYFPATQLKFMNTLDSLRGEFKKHKKENKKRVQEAKKSGNNLAITEAQKPYLEHIRHHANWIDGRVTNEAYNRSNCCNGWLVQFVSLYGPYDSYNTGRPVYSITTKIKSEDSEKGIRITMQDLKYFDAMNSFSKGDWLEVNGYFEYIVDGYIQGYWGSDGKFEGQSISLDFLDGTFDDDTTVELGERMLDNYYSGDGSGNSKGSIHFRIIANSIKKAEIPTP